MSTTAVEPTNTKKTSPPVSPEDTKISASSLPNFLIIGAQKSGTTTLAEALDLHPDIYISRPKEPHYLAYGDRLKMGPFPDPISNTRVPATTLEEYEACFAAGDGAKARGDASPSSMPMKRALERAVDLLEKPKVIAILRQPAERAYSNYQHVVARHGESCRTFAKAIEAEPGRIGRRGPLWHYVDKGFYHRQLAPWFEELGAENMKVVLFEDLKTDPAELFRDLFEFLGVDPEFEIDSERRANTTLVPRNRVVEKLIRTCRPVLSRPFSALPKKWQKHLRTPFTRAPKEIDPDIRARLTEGYREDILLLEEMIERDLSAWLKA